MMKQKFNISGNVIDPVLGGIYKGTIFVEDGIITNIKKDNSITVDKVIFPGLINSHVHIESSMITPLEFSKQAVKWGTVAVVSDPHEIANVLGKEGIKYMIENSKLSPMKFYFGVPSCVPATSFETSGAVLNSKDVEGLLKANDLYFLSEMMNYPGVIYNDEEVHKKINSAKKLNLPIDGHAPGLKGDDLKKYVNAGISTDHECTSIEEAEEKISLGMKIQIREGSAAKDFEALYKLIDKYPNEVMLCTDDTHPDDLMLGHINLLVKKCIEKGLNIINVAKAVNLNPKRHYKLNVGSLQIGDSADFIIIDSVENFNIQKTFINGMEVFNGQGIVNQIDNSVEINNFNANKIKKEDISIKNDTGKKIKVINCFDGDLFTQLTKEKLNINKEKEIISCTKNDILKIIVLNRYNKSKPVVGYIKGIGLIKGAIASSIAHDSHNIIAVGTSNDEIVKVCNQVIENKGGIVVSDENNIVDLPLEIAGLMTNSDIETVAKKYEQLNHIVKHELGSRLYAPFMTLSFMALLVIPELKIGDKGLFDGKNFALTELLT